MNDPSDFASSSRPLGTERVWHVHDRGQQFGPYAEVEIAAMLAAGTLSAAALLWREGTADWVAVTSVVPPPLRPVMPPVPPVATDSVRIAAGVCGILLGGLGVHKFVLGYTTAGVIMLLVTVCTCGFGGIVMGVIGLIEGITYLSKTDQEFRQTYVLGKKEWF